MSNFDNIKNMYFLGIGGIGMSALARYFNTRKINVAGYDKTGTALTATLEKEGIDVNFEDTVDNIPESFKNPETTLIVYTPAIPGDHEQYNYFKSEGFTVEKRSVVLGRITKGIFTLAVAGTHGKTTTTAMLAHLLKETGAEVTAFLGGLAENFNSNLVLEGTKVMVAEADEFDRSFLQLSPNIAAITSMDADHLDIYGENEQLQQSFLDFARLVPQDGTLFYKKGLPLKGTSIGIEDDADVSAENITVKNGTYHFDLNFRGEVYKDFSLSLPGKHNLFNAVTALAMAIEFGCPPAGLARALTVFKGVHRRFSYRIKNNDLILIDDYAHHPAEIAAVHQAVREMHPNKEVLAVFQPHLFSRTRDFADDFAQSLGLFDQVILLDIYPAREKPIEGITSEWLLKKIKNNRKQLVQKEALSEAIFEAVKHDKAQVILMLGAGNIGEEVEAVKNYLLS